jgi:enolase
MDVSVTIQNGTAFDTDLGDTAILTVSFTTANAITYEASTPLYFYAEITENLISQTVCFEMDGGANPLPAGTNAYTIENSSAFTASATATGKVYYTAA